MLPPARDPGSYQVCLVCLGNICRSPMADVVLRSSIGKAGLSGLIAVDSAGTGDWHIGQPMDRGAQAALRRRGYDGSPHRARQIQRSWLGARDLLLAMDRSNESGLLRLGADPSRVLLFAAAGGLAIRDIPDPYGGGAAEFDEVLDLIETAVPVLLDRLEALVAG